MARFLGFGLHFISLKTISTCPTGQYDWIGNDRPFDEVDKINKLCTKLCSVRNLIYDCHASCLCRTEDDNEDSSSDQEYQIDDYKYASLKKRSLASLNDRQVVETDDHPGEGNTATTFRVKRSIPSSYENVSSQGGSYPRHFSRERRSAPLVAPPDVDARDFPCPPPAKSPTDPVGPLWILIDNPSCSRGDLEKDLLVKVAQDIERWDSKVIPGLVSRDEEERQKSMPVATMYWSYPDLLHHQLEGNPSDCPDHVPYDEPLTFEHLLHVLERLDCPRGDAEREILSFWKVMGVTKNSMDLRTLAALEASAWEVAKYMS